MLKSGMFLFAVKLFEHVDFYLPVAHAFATTVAPLPGALYKIALQKMRIHSRPA
jgi:hypothetical protein